MIAADGVERLVGKVREQPLLAILIVAIVGVAVGLSKKLIPSTFAQPRVRGMAP
jgi:hypothetical protein